MTRRADTLVSDEVDRFPRVRRRHTTIVLAADGSIRHLEMDIRTPSEPSNQRDRHVVADVSRDSVHITKRDSTGTRTIAFATSGMLTMPHLPQMYGLTDLYFGAALRHADVVKLSAGDSVPRHQYYIDREFAAFRCTTASFGPFQAARPNSAMTGSPGGPMRHSIPRIACSRTLAHDRPTRWMCAE